MQLVGQYPIIRLLHGIKMKKKNVRSSWTFLYCLRTKLIEDRTHRATYIVEGFLCTVTAIGNIIYSVV